MKLKGLIMFYKERYIFIFTNLSIIIFLSCLVIIFTSIIPQKGSIPLHYNIFFGIDRVGLWYETFYYPAFALLLMLVNFVIGSYLFPKDKYLSYYLCYISTLCNAIVFLSLLTLLSFVF